MRGCVGACVCRYDSFSSSVVSIEGYSHAIVIVVCHSGYSNIADIRQKHDLVVVMRDNAGEIKSHKIMEFIQSTGARNNSS